MTDLAGGLGATVLGLLGGGLHLLLTLALMGVALARWQRHPRASMFALTAAVLGLVTHGLSLVAPRLVPSEVVLLVMQGIQLVSAVGYGLMVAAIFVDRPDASGGNPGRPS